MQLPICIFSPLFRCTVHSFSLIHHALSIQSCTVNSPSLIHHSLPFQSCTVNSTSLIHHSLFLSHTILHLFLQWIVFVMHQLFFFLGSLHAPLTPLFLVFHLLPFSRVPFIPFFSCSPSRHHSMLLHCSLCTTHCLFPPLPFIPFRPCSSPPFIAPYTVIHKSHSLNPSLSQPIHSWRSSYLPSHTPLTLLM